MYVEPMLYLPCIIYIHKTLITVVQFVVEQYNALNLSFLVEKYEVHIACIVDPIFF